MLFIVYLGLIKQQDTRILAIQVLCAKHTEPKIPLNVADLEQLVLHNGSETNLLNQRFVCMTLIIVLGFLMFHECASLKRSDGNILQNYMKLSIAHSKTDQYYKGQTVIISRTGKATCPVAALETYLKLVKFTSSTKAFLFRNIFFAN